MKEFTAYKNGQFIDIDSPIEFPDPECPDDQWNKFIYNQGYDSLESFGNIDMPALRIYSASLTRDMDYGYLLIIDICGEGRILFIEKWYEVLEFITKYGGYLYIVQLEVIHTTIKDMLDEVEEKRS
jgi:hypothetical protein